ncbi:MAG: diadenylate cyclase CdaA [Bacteroidales bacterium]|nr:diadenylate cyclase CdaA [Bacteroidales bacterium]
MVLLTGLFQVRFLDVLDILLVAFILYELYNLLKGSVSINMFFAIVAMFFIWRVTDALQMELLREILGAFFSVGIIALFIIFQPELRQFLLSIGKPDFIQKRRRRFLFWHFTDSSPYFVDIDKIVHACQKMSNVKQGALIIITRLHELRVIKETGQYLNADISVELLENIFYPNSPLHDGAVIIRENKIEAARCILPITRSMDGTASLGLRHRAAVGITEQSDAIAIVVSEQTGKISYSEGGKLVRNVQPSVLRDFLEEQLQNVPKAPAPEDVVPEGVS